VSSGTLLPNTAQQASCRHQSGAANNQRNTGDRLNTVTSGLNGPTSLAGIKNADNNFAQLRKALDDLGLSASTNIIISSDHGCSTDFKREQSSPAAKVSYKDTPKDYLERAYRLAGAFDDEHARTTATKNQDAQNHQAVFNIPAIVSR
jgi:hypothetical protein